MSHRILFCAMLFALFPALTLGQALSHVGLIASPPIQVTLPILIVDEKDDPIRQLRIDDFIIHDSAQLQQNMSVAQGVPLSIGFVIDVRGKEETAQMQSAM